MRRPLRTAVREELLRRLLCGELPTGLTLDEQELAAELGVSRTPVREALLSLEHDQLLEARLGAGWCVPPMDRDIVASTYPLIAVLEAYGVQTTPAAAWPEILPELRQLNEDLAAPDIDPVAIHHVDSAWHALLIARTDNKVLTDTLTALKLKATKYEYQYLARGKSVAASYAEHQAIMAALDRSDLQEATEALQLNWDHGRRALLKWIDSSASRQGIERSPVPDTRATTLRPRQSTKPARRTSGPRLTSDQR